MLAVKRKVRLLIIPVLLTISNQTIGQISSPKSMERILPKLVINDFKYEKDTTALFNYTVEKIKTAHLPFFCRIEEKMSRTARFPVRIRLGNVDYVNKLEGKGH